MKNGIVAGFVALAGLASAAMAEVNTSVVWQVSSDGLSWGGGLNVAPRTVVYCQAIVSYTGTAQPVGLASLVFQPTVSNWSSTHELLPLINNGQGGNLSNPIGVVTDMNSTTSFGRLSPWGSVSLNATNFLRGHLHTDGVGGAPAGSWMRIAQNQATGWIGSNGNTAGNQGVPISQRNDVGRTPQDPAFNSQQTNIVAFKFAFRVGLFAGTFVVDSPLSGFGNYNSATGEREVYWFGSLSESSASIRGGAMVSPANVNVLFPSPSGALGLLGGLGVLSARRVRGR